MLALAIIILINKNTVLFLIILNRNVKDNIPA